MQLKTETGIGTNTVKEREEKREQQQYFVPIIRYSFN